MLYVPANTVTLNLDIFISSYQHFYNMLNSYFLWYFHTKHFSSLHNVTFFVPVCTLNTDFKCFETFSIYSHPFYNISYKQFCFCWYCLILFWRTEVFWKPNIIWLVKSEDLVFFFVVSVNEEFLSVLLLVGPTKKNIWEILGHFS